MWTRRWSWLFIVSIPTLIVVEGGQVTGKIVGYRPKADILKLLGK